MNKSIFQATVAGLALVFFIFVAALLYVGKNRFSVSAPKTEIKKENISPEKNKTTEIIETAQTDDWRLYGSADYGYRIKYPAELTLWIPKEKKFLGGDLVQKLYWRKDSSNFIDFTVLPKDYDVYADDLEENLPYKEMTINGQKALRLDLKSNDMYSAETTIYGPKFTYQIVFNEQKEKTLEPAYNQMISTFMITDDIQPEKINYWELTAGNPTDTCSGPTYAGEATVGGWYSWDYVYVEKDWVLNISPEDAQKLPIKEILGGSEHYEQFLKKPAFIFADAPKKLQEELKQASPENPVKIKLQGFKMYCEGAPIVSLNHIVK